MYLVNRSTSAFYLIDQSMISASVCSIAGTEKSLGFPRYSVGIDPKTLRMGRILQRACTICQQE